MNRILLQSSSTTSTKNSAEEHALEPWKLSGNRRHPVTAPRVGHAAAAQEAKVCQKAAASDSLVADETKAGAGKGLGGLGPPCRFDGPRQHQISGEGGVDQSDQGLPSLRCGPKLPDPWHRASAHMNKPVNKWAALAAVWR